jgi:hypothetical protein
MICELRPRLGCPGGEVFADGELFHKNGKFLKFDLPGMV